MSAALPLSARLVPFTSAAGEHLFVVGGSRIYDIDAELAIAARRSLFFEDVGELPGEIAALLTRREGPPEPLAKAPGIAALSLNIAQSCNLGCGYCYAEQGGFGGAKRLMDADVARASVDKLLAGTPQGGRAVIAFMGGEPLLNRKLLHETVHYGAAAAVRLDRRLAFSLTTNATMITDEDAALFAAHAFSVTVSIDGPPDVQDKQRPTRRGARSSERVLAGIARLRANRPRQLDARMTVANDTGPLLPVLDYVLSLGFDSAGFAPVVVAPNPQSELQGDGFTAFTAEMIACGRHALDHMLAGRRYGFANLETALHELHRGSARAHPCGAGAGYLSIDADGDAFACHRLVGNAQFKFGSLDAGIDDDARLRHLAGNAVDSQEPCRTCWARYLCGGGCYHEVAARGRGHCDYVRSWLGFCLEAYATLSSARPLDFPHGADQFRAHP